MRDLARNQQPVFYKTFIGQVEIVDQYGNGTGSFYNEYSELKSAMLCVSPNKGSSEINMFGTLIDYDRTMTTANTELDIDENSILWLDGKDTNGPWNYIVKLKSPWFNSIAYAIQKVDVTVAQEELLTMSRNMK